MAADFELNFPESIAGRSFNTAKNLTCLKVRFERLVRGRGLVGSRPRCYGSHRRLIVVAAATRKLQNPHRFEMNGRRLVPDAIFVIEYPDQFVCFAYELDITNHGETEYREKFEWYHDLIFDGVYKKHLGMTQKLYVLTATITPVRMNNLISYLPKRSSPFLVKTIPQYGLFDKAPAPNLSILDEWQTAKGQLVSLKVR